MTAAVGPVGPPTPASSTAAAGFPDALAHLEGGFRSCYPRFPKAFANRFHVRVGAEPVRIRVQLVVAFSALFDPQAGAKNGHLGDYSVCGGACVGDTLSGAVATRGPTE